MNKPLRALLVEDSEDDALLVVRALTKGGFAVETERVETGAAMVAALGRRPWDIVIADYSLPKFSGLQALRVLKDNGSDLPFILVSGTIGEEIAVEAMQAGADDYVMKGRLARLPPAVERELREAEVRRERRALEEKLRQEEGRFRAVSENALAGIYILQEGRFAYVNPALARMIGYEPAELIGAEPSAVIHPDDYPAVAETMRLRATGRVDPLLYGFRGRRKDGSIIEVEVLGTRIELAGRPAFIGNVLDVTERKRAQLALAESQAQVLAVMNSTDDMIWFVNPVDFGLLVFNRTFREYFRKHRSMEIEPGMTPEALVPPDYAVRWREFFTRTLREGSYATEYTVVAGTKVLLLSLNQVKREHEVIGISIFGRDITERKRAEEALRWERDLFEGLAGTIPDRIYFKDQQSRFIRVNNAMGKFCRLRRPSDAIGLTDFDIFAEEHARKAHTDEQLILQTGTPLIGIEEREIWPDGRVTWAATTKMPLRDAAGNVTGLVGISRDITERKEAERRLREQAELLDKASEAIVVTDLGQKVTFWSLGAERLFGYTSAEMLGRTVEAALPLWTGARAGAIDQSIAATGQWRGEFQGFDRQGHPLSIETGVTLIRNEAGRPTGRLSISTDITEKKKLAEQFLRAQRLESLGMLAAGIAHDLNNVLAPILMATTMLRTSAADPRQLRLLDTLEKSAGRGAGLVRQILGFAHGIGGEPRPVQVKHLLRDIAEMITETFPKSIVLDEQIPSDLWPITANPTQIHQVLLNLCVNARDAMPDGGTLRLLAENCTLDADAAAALAGGKPGAWLVLHVADTGTGIAPGLLERIWEPFFTTKAAGKGTGLGLSTVRGIVETHHGFITLQTEPGQGTTFRIYLPADEAAVRISGSAAPIPAAHGHNELILLVDDEQNIRDVGRAILTEGGYQVLTANDGEEALSLFASRAAEIALVITDLQMPNRDGASLISEVRRLDPGMKIITMSGGNVAGQTAVPFNRAAEEHLRKPFTAEDLLTKVQRLLHSALPAG